MHFVKKTPTTEEERELRDKERAKKQRLYETARDRIFHKRDLGELDEEMLKLTASVLEKNPDIYTFWNIRRDSVLKVLQVGVDGESTEDAINRKSAFFTNELILTESCLKANPKSYGAWSHRGWALAHHPRPDFPRELQLCEKALKLDGRNFHCWDYRRVVAGRAQLPPEEELEWDTFALGNLMQFCILDLDICRFSNRMIGDNFSNYSAWHYRSSLLPKVHPDPSGHLPLNEETIAKELKLVANAFFTDPEDQSAWIYTGWLFEMDDHAVTESTIPLSVTVRPDDEEARIVLVLSRSVDVETVEELVDVRPAEGRWHPVSTHSRCTHSSIWRFDAACASGKLTGVHVRLPDSGDSIDATCGYVDRAALRAIYAIDKRETSETMKKAIEAVLENCRQLMQLDGDEKKNIWPLFIATRCLCRLDASAHHSEIIANLDHLAVTVDPQRAAMYRDLMSRQTIARWLRDADPETNVNRLESIIARGASKQHCDRLVGLGLTSVESLKHLAAYICDLNLAENCITSLGQFALFPRLTHLLLDDNPVESLSGVERLPSLAFLSLPRTRLAFAEQLRPLLNMSKPLNRLLFAETELVRNEEELKKTFDMFKETGIRLIPYYL